MRLFALIGLMLFTFAARAESTKPQQEDRATPKKALKYFDQLGTDEKIDRASITYHAKTDDEKKVAKAFAAVDLELARLRKAAATRFDHEAGDAMVHALHDVTPEDVDAATEAVTGDKATVSGKRFSEPLPMIKVNNAWKISLTDAIAQSQTTPDNLSATCDALVEAMKLTELEIAAEKYVNPSLLERAIKRRVRAVFGGE